MPESSRVPIDVEATAAGFNPHFEERMLALQRAVRGEGGELYVFSGARSPEEQASMLQKTAARYGDLNEAMKRIKPPGESTHDPEFGVLRGLGRGALGADVRGDLHIAHEMGHRFGLVFPSQTQPWHMEYAGLDKIKS
jgi:hypothetical protein